jgi:hypothetical protein
MEFEAWLASEGLSATTARKYVSAIKGPLTTWGFEHKIISKPISQVTDPDEFAVLSELIERTEIFTERNLRGNNMYGAALNNYARYLARTVDVAGGGNTYAGKFSDQLTATENSMMRSDPFEPTGHEDARERVLRAVVRRQGQPKFRASLIAAYEGRCAITSCRILVILEAAHVTPYLGPHTNSVGNGLLLRADIHTLWDLGLIAIHPQSMTVAVSPHLHDRGYRALHGGQVFQPIEIVLRVSPLALAQQWAIFEAQMEG